jgi:hypothetical protein
MIPNTLTRGTVTSTFDDTAERIPMIIDPEAMPFIMDILTKTYSDEELACVREYATNALDSHIVAGVTRPIEVFTPTPLSPFLRIKDYGTGMSRLDMRDTYSKYGRSNKRTDTRVNGTMGIGSKSALAYASQFTVIGTKDGVRVSVAVSIGADGSPDMQIVDESKTAEPNGVEILVPARKHNEFLDKAKNLFQYWDKGLVLLNGKEPAAEFDFISDRIAIAPKDQEEDVIVMGGVPYPVKDSERISTGPSYITAFVKMNVEGDQVSFLPSRETLIYNDVTMEAIKSLTDEYNERILARALNETATAQSLYHAVRAYHKALNALKRRSAFATRLAQEAEYRGVKVAEYFKKHFDTAADTIQYYPSRSARGRGDWDNMRVVFGADMASSVLPVVVTDYPSANLASAHKARIKAYLGQRGVKFSDYYNYMLLTTGSQVPIDYLDGIHTVTWKDLLAATRPERGASGGSTLSDVYSFYTDASTEVRGTLDANDQIFYTAQNTWRARANADVRDYLFAQNPGAKIVVERNNRLPRLKRNYPKAQPLDLNDIHQRVWDAKYDALSDEEKVASFYQYYASNEFSLGWHQKYFVERVSVDKVDDPRYTLIKEVISKGKGSTLNPTSLYNWSTKWNNGYKKFLKDQNFSSIDNVSKDYPLVDAAQMNDSILYINAKYKQIQERNQNA